MLKVTDETEVTLAEAAELLGVRHKRVDSWERGGKFRKVGYRGPVAGVARRANNLYRLGDVRKAAEQIGGDQRGMEVPAGCMRIGEAASRLGLTVPTTVARWHAGAITGVTRPINTRGVARFPSEESVARYAAALAKADDRGGNTEAVGKAAAEILDATPVLYGVLSADDAAVLAVRRERFERMRSASA